MWSRASMCVCLCVCLSAAVRPHYCTDPDVTWGHGRGCLLVVHYWADLQSGHGLRCYGNITRTLVPSLRPSRDDDIVRTAGWAGSARVAAGAGRRHSSPDARRRPATGGRRGAPPKPRAAYGKRARPARRRLAADGGVLNITAAVWNAGFPLVAFWQQKANAKC